MAFSPCGERLVVVTGDNRHTVGVYDWKSKQLLQQGVGHNGQPPQVRAVHSGCKHTLDSLFGMRNASKDQSHLAGQGHSRILCGVKQHSMAPSLALGAVAARAGGSVKHRCGLPTVLQVYGVRCNPFTSQQDADGKPLPSPAMFVTYGVKHLKFWIGTADEVGSHIMMLYKCCLCPHS